MEQPEHAVALVSLAFLCVGGIWMVWMIRRGREVIHSIAQRLPAEYEQLGKPWPGYGNDERTTRYHRFLFQREYVAFGEPYVSQLEEQRSVEIRFMAFLLGGFGVLGLAAVWLRWFA